MPNGWILADAEMSEEKQDDPLQPAASQQGSHTKYQGVGFLKNASGRIFFFFFNMSIIKLNSTKFTTKKTSDKKRKNTKKEQIKAGFISLIKIDCQEFYRYYTKHCLVCFK